MYKALLSLISLGLFCPVVRGQTAVDYFHRGAQLYIADKKSESKKAVETGLGLYPQDPLLNGMAGLLKKEEEKQQQQQQSQKEQPQQDQQKQDQQEKQQQQDQQKQDQQQSQNQQPQQQSQQGQQEQQQQPQQGQDKEQQGQQAAAQDQQGDQKGQNEATAPGQMTPQEARQLLDSRKQDEKALPANPANGKEGRTRNRPIKDW